MKRNGKVIVISVFKCDNQAGWLRRIPDALVIILLSVFILGAQEFSSGGSALPSKRDTANSAEWNIKSLARVNPTTLAMEMTLPVISYPGRNSKGLSVDFRYSSNLWRQEGTHTWWLPGGSGNRQYISDIFALYAEHSAAGWTSSLLPPRLDIETATYNFMGNPYGDSVNGGILNEDFQAALYSILGQGSSLTGSVCHLGCTTWAITVDGQGDLVRAVCAAYSYSRCSSPYDDPDPGVTPIENANNLYYVKRLRVVMPDGSTHEFRQSDEVIQCGDFQNGCTGSFEGPFLSVDGSGMILKKNTGGGYTLLLPSGDFYTFPSAQQSMGGHYASTFTDVNGNRMSYSETEQNFGTDGKWTDTLGRHITDPIPHVWHAQTQPLGTREFTVPGIDGDPSQSYQIVWKNLKPVGCETSTDENCVGADHITTGGALENQSQRLYYSNRFLCTGYLKYDLKINPDHPDEADEVLFTEVTTGVRPCNPIDIRRDSNGNPILIDGFPIADGVRFNPVVLSEVTLPNGQSYKFGYNQYGEITRIKYPTGSFETFEYGKVAPLSGLGGFNEPYEETNRGVKIRRVFDASGTLQQKWTYFSIIDYQNFTQNNYPVIVTTTSSKASNPEAVGTKTVKYILRDNEQSLFGYNDPKAGSPYDERTYDENNELRSRVLTEYTTKDHPLGTITARRDVRVKRRISMILEPGSAYALATLNETTYDENGNTDPSFFSHLNVKLKKSYHYVPIPISTASSPLLNWATIDNNLWFPSTKLAAVSEMDYSYSSNYKERGILGLPIESRLLNPQNQTEILAQSQVIYDEQGEDYSMVDYGSTTSYQTPTGTYAHLRGNPTTKRTWNKDTNTWIETHTQFDNFGNVRKVWDTSGDLSRFLEYEYDSIYKYAYVTKTKAPAPDPSGVHGMTIGSEITRTFDFTTGVPLSVTDANGQTATTEYDDMLRPIRINPPAGGAISETEYNDTERWVKSRQQIDGTNWAERTTYFDTLGRPFKSKTKDAQGDVFSEIKYDNLGRIEKVSNPYRLGETMFWSKPRYDAAGRVVETFAPAPDGQAGASLGTVQFGISTENGLVGGFTVATDASGRKSRTISGIYGIMRVDEATGMGGTVDQDLGSLASPNQPTSYTYNIKGELVKITQGKAGQPGQPIQNRYFMYDSLGRLIRVSQPEQSPNSALTTSGNPENNSWTAGFTYDVFGNVVTMTDAKNTTITNEYDKASRPTKRLYSDGTTPPVEYFYDGKGLPAVPQFSRGSITKVTNGISEDRFTTFDNHGRLLASQQITDGQTYGFGYQYNQSGGLVQETYPSGRTVKNYLNSDGGLNAVKTKVSGAILKPVVSNIDYSASGDVRKIQLGNNLWETAVVSERSQLMQIGLGTTETNKNLLKIDYEYGELSDDGSSVDRAKNIGMIARTTTTIPTTSFTQTFKYDAINRLKEAKEKTGTQTNWQQTFGYDIFGNRTSFSQTVGNQQLPINNLTHPAIDPANNRFTTGQGYVYDYNGNLIQDAEGRHFTFDGNDKQTEVRNANNDIVGQYYYDASGARVKKVVPSTGETTVFVYDAGGALAAEYSTVAQTEIPTTSYLTTDHLGSPRVITDQNQNVVSRRDFMPFGEEIGEGVGARTAALKYSASGSDKIRKRYTGYEKDPETELDFAEARLYQNKHGRFTAVDPLMSSASPTNPQTFNRYAYTGNNPVNNIDPSGLCVIDSKEDGMPCNNFKGQVYQNSDKTFSTSSADGGTAYNGPTITRTFYGIVYEISAGGWRQVGTSAEVLAQARAIIRGSSAGTATDPVLAGSSSPNGAHAPAGALSLPCPAAASGCGSGNEVADHLVEGASPEEVVELIHTTMDGLAATEIPLISQGAGIGSALIDVGHRDWVGAGMSIAGLLPFAGDAADAAKIARRVGKATHVAEEVVESAKVSEGIYEFVATTGKTYVGQSGNIAKRLEQHIASGLLERGAAVETKQVLGGRTAREIAEQLRINALGGVEKLQNVRNPIGKAREYLLSGL